MKILDYDSVDPLSVLHLTLLALDFPFTPEHAAHIRRTDLRPFPCFTVNAGENDIVLGQVGVFRLPMISTAGREDVGGVWAVSTHPAHSGLGVASALLEATHTRMRDAGLRFSTLGTDRYRRAYKLYQQHVHVDMHVWATALTEWEMAHQPTRLRAGGGYLPWHNFDEGAFDPSDYEKVSTDAFLAISEKHNVCNKCRHVFCTRGARVAAGPYAGEGVRPEFETIALWINCCILDRDAIFHLNALCTELGVDTMTFGSVMAGAMELQEKGLLARYTGAAAFGDAPGMVRTLKEIAYASTDLGRLFGRHSDRVIAELAAASPSSMADVAYALTTAFGGLGYAGINPKAFPGMFTAYGTSNRGRGDHTYAWTVQAEEGGLKEARDLAAYVAEGQMGKALVDSLGLCDFFTGDITAEPFVSLYRALAGVEYTPESLKACGRRIYALERRLNNAQGRDRTYDAFVPPKLTVPLTRGAHRGRAVDEAFYNSILDAYYEAWGWTDKGTVF